MPDAYADLLRRSMDEHAARPALSFPEESLTYGDLALRLGGIVREFERTGVGPGEVVATYTDDKRAILLADLAAMLMGAIALPLNNRFTAPEMEYYMEDAEPALVITDEAGRGVMEGLGDRRPADISAVLDAPTAPLPQVDIAPGDPAFMLYSSGTTGRPKGVLHRHDNLAAALVALRDTWARILKAQQKKSSAL